MHLQDIKTLSNALSLMTGVDIEKISVEETLEIILKGAKESKASDIVIVPGDVVSLKYRMQGNLVEVRTLSKDFYNELLPLIKRSCGLRPDEHLKTQQGKGMVMTESGPIDVGVVVTPEADGEKCELSISDSSMRKYSLESLGFREDQVKGVEKACREKNGIVVVCGERGSGRTTTVYGLLNYLKSLDLSISTVERSIFYKILGIDQRKSDNYTEDLKETLKGDPDVILVDDLKTKEEGNLAVKAVMEGCLIIVVTTLSDSEDVVTKLKDLGMGEFFILNSLRLVIVPKLEVVKCPSCDGRGCRFCDGTGKGGKVGVFETLTIKHETDTITLVDNSAKPHIFGGILKNVWKKTRSNNLLK